MIKNWIDIVRSYEYFNLLGMNQGHRIEPTDVSGGDYTLVTKYDDLFEVKVVPNDFEKKYGPPPRYIGASYCRNYLDSENSPNSTKAKPAQQAGNISFFWSKEEYNAPGMYHLPADEDGLRKHRGDLWPAVVEMINIQKHYSSGLLNRESKYPAIRADYIIASWYEEGNLYRANGPAIVNLRGYKEYWVDGVYKGYDMDNHTLTWKTTMAATMEDSQHQEMLEFVENSKETDLFTNHYFLNADDEFCFISDYSSYS